MLPLYSVFILVKCSFRSELIFFKFLLHLLEWHWLIKLHRLQLYISVIPHQYISLCVHYPKSDLLPSELIFIKQLLCLKALAYTSFIVYFFHGSIFWNSHIVDYLLAIVVHRIFSKTHLLGHSLHKTQYKEHVTPS